MGVQEFVHRTESKTVAAGVFYAGDFTSWRSRTGEPTVGSHLTAWEVRARLPPPGRSCHLADGPNCVIPSLLSWAQASVRR
ncbi:hypothetical protein VTK73DRAFT_5016 [Phialemonium thermophilum]|uniref:Amine oxidase domain-containing protein n=1 Tax=Phialemonium thermophilum TaxID=223376 RepID=A0ABR3V4B7_9PEZI